MKKAVVNLGFLEWKVVVYIGADLRTLFDSAVRTYKVNGDEFDNVDLSDHGQCWGYADRHLSIIFIREQSLPQVLATLAHEIVHATWDIGHALSLELELGAHHETQCYMVSFIMMETIKRAKLLQDK